MVEVTCTVDVVLIKDASNQIMLHRVQPFTYSRMGTFKGTSISVEHVDRLKLVGDIATDSKRVEPTTNVDSEGDTGTLAPASTFIFPLCLLVIDLVTVL